MTTAEFLPDKTNIINEDGDVVPADIEPTEDFLDENAEFADPAEVYHSPNYYAVEDMILGGIEKSHADGYASPKIRVGERMKPLGQFLAVDLYKYGLPMEEIRDLLERFKPQAGATRAIGRAAVSDSLRNEPAPDVRMLAANDDTYKD